MKRLIGILAVVILTFTGIALAEGPTVNNWCGNLNDFSCQLGKDGKSYYNLYLRSGLIFEGATSDAYETTFTVTEPTADRTITFPNASGTVSLTTGGYVGSGSVNTAAIEDAAVTSAKILNGTIATVDLANSIVTAPKFAYNTVSLALPTNGLYNTVTVEAGSVFIGSRMTTAAVILNAVTISNSSNVWAINTNGSYTPSAMTWELIFIRP